MHAMPTPWPATPLVPCGASLPVRKSVDAPPISELERWTDGFLQRLAVWGEAAGHHRVGSWERYASGSSVK